MRTTRTERGGRRAGAGRPLAVGHVVRVRVSALVWDEARTRPSPSDRIAGLAEDGLVLGRLLAEGVVDGPQISTARGALSAK